jgi:hypothetical protein
MIDDDAGKDAYSKDFNYNIKVLTPARINAAMGTAV